MSGTPPGTSSGQLVVNVQILRFAAAFLVVISHVIDIAMARGLRLGPDLANFGAIGVDIFFVISGFIIARTGIFQPDRDWREFATSRVQRVVPLYWLLSAPWVIITLFDGTFWIRRIIVTLTFWPALGNRVINPVLEVGWTLCFEMLFYGAVTLLLAVKVRRAAVPILLAYAVAWWLREITEFSALRFLGNPIILEFLAGVAIAFLIRHGTVGYGKFWLALGLAGIIASIVVGFGSISEAYLITDGTLSLRRVLVWGIPSTLLVLGAVTTEVWARGAMRTVLVQLGDASYAIYLVHPLWLLSVSSMVRGGWFTSLAIMVFVGLVGSVVLGLAIHYALELPLRKRRRRRTLRA